MIGSELPKAANLHRRNDQLSTELIAGLRSTFSCTAEFQSLATVQKDVELFANVADSHPRVTHGVFG